VKERRLPSAGGGRLHRARRWQAVGRATAIAAALMVGVLAGAPAALSAQAPPSTRVAQCDGQWHRVKAANRLHDYGDTDMLSAVASISSTDAWAVGITDDFDLPPYGYRALAEHWDGHSWRRVRMPSSQTYSWTEMSGVLALASNDVWAVGLAEDSSEGYSSMIEHWDGTRWTIQNQGVPDTYLTSVTGLAADDIWAAGSTNYVGNGLIMHWNGTSWTRTTLPHAINFRAIDELAPNDIWAVGQLSTARRLDLTTAWHFDGKSWTRFPTPSPLKIHAEDENWLNGVDAISSTDIWAAGVSRDPDWGIRDKPFMLHWNGRKWVRVATPDPGGDLRDTALLGVVGNATDDVWAVGRVGPEDNYRTFTVHWDGRSWSQVPSSPRGAFAAASTDGRGGILAVGTRFRPGYTGFGTLVEGLCPA
jgi:hypothetical protein